MQLQGFIRNASKRAGKSKRPPYKPYTVYDAEIHADDGTKTQVSFGFDEPEVGPGDYVRLDAFDKNGFLQVDQSTVVRLAPPEVPPKADSGSVQGQPAATGTGENSSAGNYAVKEFGYQTHPVDAKRITFAAANGRAIEVVALLLANDALPHSKAKGKGGEAQRYQEIMAAIDKVTVKMFNDAMTMRSLDVVADEGVIVTKPSSKLPDDGSDDKADDEGLDD